MRVEALPLSVRALLWLGSRPPLPAPPSDSHLRGRLFWACSAAPLREPNRRSTIRAIGRPTAAPPSTAVAGFDGPGAGPASRRGSRNGCNGVPGSTPYNLSRCARTFVASRSDSRTPGLSALALQQHPADRGVWTPVKGARPAAKLTPQIRSSTRSLRVSRRFRIRGVAPGRSLRVRPACSPLAAEPNVAARLTRSSERGGRVR